MVKRCPGLLVALPHFTHLSWEFMKLPPGSEANQRTTLSTARTVDAEQRTTRGRRSSSRRRREQQKCHLFVNLPTQHQICEVNKTKGRQQDSQTAQVSEAEADAGYAGAGALHGNVRRKRF